MAKAKKAQTRVSNWKKKKLFLIQTCSSFKNTPLGQTMVEEGSLLLGRGISSNLMMLTGDMRKQNITVKFKINNISGNKATAEPVGYAMNVASIKRIVRRGKDRVDLSFTCITKDNKKIRVKPIIITKNCTSKSVLSSLRKNCLILVMNLAKETNYQDIITQIINNRLQKELHSKLKKIYPLRTVEIKAFGIEKEKKEQSEEEVVHKEEVNKPKVEEQVVEKVPEVEVKVEEPAPEVEVKVEEPVAEEPVVKEVSEPIPATE